MPKPKEQKLFALLSDNTALVQLRGSLTNAATRFEARAITPTTEPVATNLRAPIDETAPVAGVLVSRDRGVPQPDDFIEVKFRVLSASLSKPEMSGMVLDFTQPGLLEAAAAKLVGVPVRCNHWSYDVKSFYGVATAAEYDAAGTETDGVAGLNATLSVSKVLGPELTYGLLMTPPAIGAISAGLLINFEYSHPQLEKYLFWELMGTEVEGQIVRLIVTEIVKFREVSFVDDGADLYNRRLSDADDFEDKDYDEPLDDTAASTGKKKTKAGMASQHLPPEAKGEKTVKLKQAMIAALGLQGDESTEFAEAQLQSALPALVEKVQLADNLLGSLREQVKGAALRVAALTHKGDGQPTLDTRDALLIGKADAAELATLQKHYDDQLAANLTATCQACGTKVTSLRSSVDSRVDSNAPEFGDDETDASVTLL